MSSQKCQPGVARIRTGRKGYSLSDGARSGTPFSYHKAWTDEDRTPWPSLRPKRLWGSWSGPVPQIRKFLSPPLFGSCPTGEVRWRQLCEDSLRLFWGKGGEVQTGRCEDMPCDPIDLDPFWCEEAS